MHIQRIRQAQKEEPGAAENSGIGGGDLKKQIVTRIFISRSGGL